MAIWLDYTVEQGWNRFRVTGDWDREVMGYDRDGNKTATKGTLYQEGDVYIVKEDGWLHKVDDLTKMILLHPDNKSKQSQQHDPKP